MFQRANLGRWEQVGNAGKNNAVDTHLDNQTLSSQAKYLAFDIRSTTLWQALADSEDKIVFLLQCLGRVDICVIMVICQPSPYLIGNGQK